MKKLKKIENTIDESLLDSFKKSFNEYLDHLQKSIDELDEEIDQLQDPEKKDTQN